MFEWGLNLKKRKKKKKKKSVNRNNSFFFCINPFKYKAQND